MSYKTQDFQSFSEFYPFYLSEHRSYVNRCLHVMSTHLYLSFLLYQLFFGNAIYILYCPLIAYGPAWIGHYFYEQNKPATLTYPRWSFIGDHVMVKDILLGRLPKLHEKYGIVSKT
mmetsp:Transcript_33713/g.35006  ORF Transcript_33713/g.35006 Transcript_33713/m.35006 type:complete len:116 (+) Transcript_33713:14-361(+)